MLIKNGMLILEGRREKKDMRTENGIIKEIENQLEPYPGEEVLDVSGSCVMPGGIDVHTHFDAPVEEDLKTSDDFYYGTRAALAGGTTTIIDFAEPDPKGPLSEGLKLWHEKADGNSFCDYSFHMTVPRFDEEMPGQIAEMLTQGITSFKTYTAYQETLGVTDAELYRMMQTLKKAGAVLCVHCENGDVLSCRQQDLKNQDPRNLRNHPLSRPNLVEKEAVSKVIDIAALTGTKVYIVHVSTKEAMQVIQAAKENGQPVMAETCPHYLLLDDSQYELPGFEGAKYVMSPPLRSREDKDALRNMLREGPIDTISTDHCSFNYVGQKDRGKEDFTRIPNGIPSAEHRMELMLEMARQENIPLERIAELTALNPAKIFGMYPQKGTLKAGSDADFIVVQPDRPHEIRQELQYQRVDYTPYEGFTVAAKIQHVFLRGQWQVKDGTVTKDRPSGAYLFRNTGCECDT